jgi:hypothetical protein
MQVEGLGVRCGGFETRNPKPETRNPKPETRHLEADLKGVDSPRSEEEEVILIAWFRV